MSEAGYSGTPLPKKLGLKDGQRVAFLNLPKAHAGLRTAAGFASVASRAAPGDDLDVVHVFVASKSDLEPVIENLRASIHDAGMIWVSWPKKASRVETDVTEDVVRDLALANRLVDVKVCAVDAVWSGLKLMVPRALRG